MDGYVKKIVKQARQMSYHMMNLSTAKKNSVLRRMSEYLMKNRRYIMGENKKDVLLAKKYNLKQSLIDRLVLNDERIKEMSVSLKEVSKLPDPVGREIWSSQRPNGLDVKKIRVPIGVILIIYEARPNVTSDCVGLLFKTSNIGVLRGGSSARYSNNAVGLVLGKALKDEGINFPAFFVVEKPGHNVVDSLLKEKEYIDLVIPRGGEALIKKVVEKSSIPVIKHYKGVCHIFVDKTADIKKALKICVNAKAQRPSVCNAVETILVHKDIASKFLPMLKKEFDCRDIIIRGDKHALQISPGINKASQKDWATEYLDLIVSLKIVKDIDEAISHINNYGSHHTDSIITDSSRNSEQFLKEVDSACCFVNISTRFSDGYQLGLGAEIGISTDKIHARGPMGLEDLTTYKYIVKGNGQIRE